MTLDSYKLRKQDRLDQWRHAQRMEHLWSFLIVRFIALVTFTSMGIALILRWLGII